jgi:putative drug exporter of the RND superfamily
VTNRESRPTGRSGGFWHGLGRAIVWLRFVILAAWIAAVVLATINLPSAFEGESSDAESLVPHSSQAVEVEERAIKTFGEPLISRTMVVAGRPQGFTAAQLSAAAHRIAATDRSEGARAIRAVPLVDTPGLLVIPVAATVTVAAMTAPAVSHAARPVTARSV